MEMNFFGSKRSIVCALSLVALLSVALGRTIPDYSVEKTSESLVEFVDKPVKKSVVNSENAVGRCSNPSIVDYCKVDVGSYGQDDSRKCGYVKTSGGSSEVIPNPNELTRGIILFELDPITCTTVNRQFFDTWGFADHRVRLAETMDSAPPGTIFIGVTQDSAETAYLALRDSVNWFFIKYNMSLSGMDLQYREKFVFIMQSGYPNKTIYHHAGRGGNCLERSFTLKVTRVTDVKFH